MTIKMGFGFNNRIYCTFIKLVATVHKSLIHCHLLPTGHSTGSILTSNWTPPLLPRTPSILILICHCQSQTNVNDQSASLPWNEASILSLRPNFCYCQTIVAFFYVGRSLWQENGSAVYNCCSSSPEQSCLGPSPAGLLTVFYCFRFETPPTWRARFPYLYPPGREWPSYTPRHRVPFSSPTTTRRAPLISQSQSQSYIATDGQSASLSWYEAPIWGLRPDIYFCQTTADLLIWGSLSDEGAGL
jgi:hypothetical protein